MYEPDIRTYERTRAHTPRLLNLQHVPKRLAHSAQVYPVHYAIFVLWGVGGKDSIYIHTHTHTHTCTYTYMYTYTYTYAYIHTYTHTHLSQTTPCC